MYTLLCIDKGFSQGMAKKLSSVPDGSTSSVMMLIHLGQAQFWRSDLYLKSSCPMGYLP